MVVPSMGDDLSLRYKIAELRGFTNIGQRGDNLWGVWPGEKHHQKCKVPPYEVRLDSAGSLWNEMSEWAAAHNDVLVITDISEESGKSTTTARLEVHYVRVDVRTQDIPGAKASTRMARAIALLYVKFHFSVKHKG